MGPQSHNERGWKRRRPQGGDRRAPLGISDIAGVFRHLYRRHSCDGKGPGPGQEGNLLRRRRNLAGGGPGRRCGGAEAREVRSRQLVVGGEQRGPLQRPRPSFSHAGRPTRDVRHPSEWAARQFASPRRQRVGWASGWTPSLGRHRRIAKARHGRDQTTKDRLQVRGSPASTRDLQMAIVQGTMLYGAELTWNERRGWPGSTRTPLTAWARLR